MADGSADLITNSTFADKREISVLKRLLKALTVDGKLSSGPKYGSYLLIIPVPSISLLKVYYPE